MTNTKNETLCSGTVTDMMFSCVTNGAIYGMEVNVLMESSEKQQIQPFSSTVSIDNATYTLVKQFAPKLADGTNSSKPTVTIQLQGINCLE